MRLQIDRRGEGQRKDLALNQRQQNLDVAKPNLLCRHCYTDLVVPFGACRQQDERHSARLVMFNHQKPAIDYLLLYKPNDAYNNTYNPYNCLENMRLHAFLWISHISSRNI